MFLQKHCRPYLEINLLQLRFVSFIFQSNHPAWWSLTWCTLGFPVSLSGLKRPLVSNNIIYITQSRSRAGFTPSRLNWKINSRQVLTYHTSFQFLALPFAITHEAVTNIYEEKLPGTETPAWYGSVDSHDWGVWTDYAFLLLFGGIPWQCYYQVSRQHPVSRSINICLT